MKVIAICSGGLDSTVLYYFLKHKGHEVKVLNFSYGSKHNKREREHLKQVIPESDIIFFDIDLSMFKSALLASNDAEIPEGHYADENMKSTVVPFRNGIMLAYAIGLAESMDFDAVALGNHTGDHAIYPDCRSEFINLYGEAARVGTYKQIKLLSPFCDKRKEQIVEIGHKLGIDDIMAKTWSCYKGGDMHCGKCGTCFERKEAFKLAGVEDKTAYQK